MLALLEPSLPMVAQVVSLAQKGVLSSTIFAHFVRLDPLLNPLTPSHVPNVLKAHSLGMVQFPALSVIQEHILNLDQAHALNALQVNSQNMAQAHVHYVRRVRVLHEAQVYVFHALLTHFLWKVIMCV